MGKLTIMTSTVQRRERASTSSATRPLPRRTFNVRTALTILAFLAPAFIFVLLFTYYPLARGSEMAFRQWNLWDLTNTPWIGFDNFRTLIADPLFAKTMVNSAIWVGASLI